MANPATRNTAYFIAAVRQLSNTENDPIITDPEITNRCSEAKASLYDIIVGAYEHYAVKTFDFSLTGGVGQNSAPLPSDFYKDVSLDVNPTSTPRTIHRFSSWVERNNLPRWQYTIFDNSVIVSPPQLARGDYRLYYTPLDKPFCAPVVVAHNAADAVVASTGAWTFVNGSFDSTFIGAAMTIVNAANAGNNGTFVILAVTSPTTVVTATAGLMNETFGASVTDSFQMAGTIDVLPQIFQPWYEYIQVHASIAVKDKIEQDTADLEVRLDRLTQRINSMAAARMEEGGQVGLTRDQGAGWWLDGNWPGGG